jgi:fused signal recognition particle receptor
MFESLKKKLLGWLGKEEKKEGKKAKKPKKEEKEIKKLAKARKESKKTKGGEIGVKERIIEVSEPKKEEAEGILEEVKEEGKKEEEVKEGSFFSRIFKKFSAGHKLTQEEFDEIFHELEIIMFENNVALEVVEKMKGNLSKSLVGAEIKKAEIEKLIVNTLKNTILEILVEPPNLLHQIKGKQGVFVILFFGINGSGKTTTIAKLANKLKQNNISSVLAAADTFRAASIEQLQAHGKRIGVEVISHQYGSDPASVAFDAIQYAKKSNIKVVLIDTAGRMYTKTNLLKEMEKIVRVSQPDLKIFVGESITGNDAIEQAKTFNEAVGIDGIILSKADVDEKAGTILSVSYVTNKPIYYLGTGQNYEDLADFKKKDVLKHLGLE